jgi:hypothetical protein
MTQKIKISLICDDGKESDFIAREIPNWNKYNFVSGILVDLNLLFSRNESKEWFYILEQIRKMELQKFEEAGE